MADSPSSPKSASPAATAAAARRPTLLPQAEHAGKPAMPLGAHQFTLIGSRNRAHLHLLSTTISRNHACIVLTKGGLYVRDLASRAGVLLNGRKVKESDLHDGDLVQVGSFKFKFQDPGGSIRLPAAPRAPLAMLEMDGRSLTPLDERTILVGRRPGCDITLDSPSVSNTHAVIFECDGKRYVRDLGSRTGTLVNGTAVHQQVLGLSDQVTIGDTTFRYIAAEMPPLEGSEVGLPLEADLPASAEPRQEDLLPEGIDFAEPALEPEPTEPAFANAADDEDEDAGIPLVHDEPPSAAAIAETRHELAPESQPLELATDDLEELHRVPVAVPLGVEIAPARHHPAGDVATAEDLGLDWMPEGQEGVAAQPHEESAAGIVFVNDLAAAKPLVEPITELSSIGFPLITPEAEIPVIAPAGLIREWEDEPEGEPLATDSEPVAAEPPAADETSAAIKLPSEAALAAALPPVEPEAAAAIPEAPVEPINAEPEASAIELADENAMPNAGGEPTPEPITEEGPVEIAAPADPAELLAVEPEAPSPEVQQAPVTGQALEPAPITEPPVDGSNGEPAAEIPEAYELETESVVTASEPAAADSGITIHEADAAPIAESPVAPSESPIPAEPLLDGAEAVPKAESEATAAPLRAENVDLSAADFKTESVDVEGATETDESAGGAAPLLDLAPTPTDEVVSPAEVPVEPEPDATPEPDKSKRKARVRKKPARARKKKGEPTEAADLTAAADAVADAAAGSGLVAAIAPTASESGAEIVAAETTLAIADQEPERAADSEPSAFVAPEPVSTADPNAQDAAADDSVQSLEPAAELTEITAITATLEPAAGESTATAPAELESSAGLTSPAVADNQGIITEAPVETIAPTEPTVESALDLEPALEEVQPSPEEVAEAVEPGVPADDAALSDTAFGAAMRDFAGADLGPLVEDSAAAAHATPNEAVETDVAPPVSHEPEPVAYESGVNAALLSPLGGADLPPLELGDDLTFGGDEKPAVQAEAELHMPTAHEALQLSDLDDATEAQELTPHAAAAEDPLDLGAATEIQLDMGRVGSAAEPTLEFGDVEGLDQALPSLDLDEEHSEVEAAAFAKPQAAEIAEDKLPSEPGDSQAIDLDVSDYQGPTSAEPVAAASPDDGNAEPEALAPAAEPAQPSAAPRPPLDPFFGMGRDMGSFIGGMPLSLNAAGATAAATAATAATTTAAATPASAATASGSSAAPVTRPAAASPSGATQPADLHSDLDLDKLFEGEEPLELFDETAEQLDKLPEVLAPISDVSGALAEPNAGPAPATSAPGVTSPAGPIPAPIAPPPTVAAPAPLRTLTADPASASPRPAQTNVAIPPFAGARPPARPGMRAFSGMGAVRPTDVFSQHTLPPLDPSAFKPQPIEDGAKPTVAPMAAQTPQPVGPAPPVNSGLQSLAEASKRTAERPPVAPRGAEPPRRRPWWRNLRVLLPLLIVLLAAAVAAIIYFFSPKTLVQGTLQIKGADDRTADVWARHDEVSQVRNGIKDPELRADVLSNLQARGIAPGFVQDANAFTQLADPSNSPFQDGRLVLKRPQLDPQDPLRMLTILDVIYQRNQTPAEQMSQARTEAADATKKAGVLQEQVGAQKDQVKKLSDTLAASTGTAATGVLADPAAAVNGLENQGIQLEKALRAANAEVRRQHDAWEQAQAASKNTVVDPKVVQIRQNLASLNARLSVAQLTRNSRVDPAKTFDDAVQQVNDDLSVIVTATAGAKDSAVASYAVAARSASAQIHSMINQAQEEAARINELRRQLAEHREAHLRQVWAADDKLKDLLVSRDVQAHRFSAASDSGYTEDASRLQGAVEQLDQQIEDRRQALATTGQSSDDLQQKLEQTIQQLQGDRQEIAAKITQAMGTLQVPSTTKISAQENSMLVAVAKDVASAQAEHDAYAATLNGKRPAGDVDTEIRKLESQVAEQQAQLDAYQQRPDAPAQVTAARQALDAAQAAQDKAQQALADNVYQLMIARQYRNAKARLAQTSDELIAAQQAVQAKLASAAAVPVVLRPDPQAAVQVVRDEDPRVMYLVVTLGVLVALFAIPLWLAGREPEADVPYAHVMTEPREALGQHSEDLQADDALPDGEHAALT